MLAWIATSAANEGYLIAGIALAAFAFLTLCAGIVGAGYKLLRRLDRLEQTMTPNGLDTNQIGDVAGRIEQQSAHNAQLVSALDRKLSAHIEECERRWSWPWRRKWF